jgi:hypothetical protein
VGLQSTGGLFYLQWKCIESDDWPAHIDGNTKWRGFFLGFKGFFQQNSVHGSQMRILCGFYAKGQEFVRIRLEEGFPNAFKTMKIHMHKLRKSSQDKCK